MDYLLLFIFNGICGYFFQAIGYFIMIYATNRIKLKPLVFFGISALFAILTFGIRSIPIISTGFHTMLTLTSFIFISVFLLKVKIFPTVIGVLSSTMIILFCEIIVVGVTALVLNTTALTSDGTIQGDIRKAIYGIPVNIMLILIAFIVYKVRTKNKEKADFGTLSE